MGYFIRPMQMKDFDALVRFAFRGEEGMSSLPKNADQLREKLESSERAFAANVERPVHELYYFALEDSETGEVGGMCAISTKKGIESPLYVFQVENVHKKAVKGIPKVSDVHTLKAVSFTDAPTELCTLFLEKQHRKSGVGRLLSLSRFLFIAAFPQRFDDELFAEMRGYIDDQGISPFYEGVLHHFVNLDRANLIRKMEKGFGFVPYILPDHHIYTELLPETVKVCIGKVHPNTVPALKMLQEEGFEPIDKIDLIDGGIWISAPLTSVRAIRESHTTTVGVIAETPLSGEDYLISNERIAFRCCLGKIDLHTSRTATIEENTAKALQVLRGDTIRYVPLRPVKETS